MVTFFLIMLYSSSFGALQATVRRMGQPVLVSLSCGPKNPVVTAPSDVTYFIKRIAETQLPVLVNVAAYIRRHTIEGFDGCTPKVAQTKARKVGDVLTSALQDSLASIDNVQVVEWETLSQEPTTRHEIKKVKDFYKTNKGFQEQIDNVAWEFVMARCAKQPRSPLTLSRGLTTSTQFLLEEFASLHHGLTYQDKEYRLHLYPALFSSVQAYHHSALNTLLSNLDVYRDLSHTLVEKDTVSRRLFVYSLLDE